MLNNAPELNEAVEGLAAVPFMAAYEFINAIFLVTGADGMVLLAITEIFESVRLVCTLGLSVRLR